MSVRHRLPRSLRYLLIALSALSAAIVIWVTVVVMTRPDYVAPDVTGWRTGDIFFSVGDSWESVAVRSITGAKAFELNDSTPSHCGVVIRRGSSAMLVHASPVVGHVVMESPDEYLRNNGAYCIYVRSMPCAIDSVRLTACVDSLVADAVPFDYDFDHTTPGALYCTEFVVTLAETLGCNDFSHLRKQGYIYPQDIANICK